MKPITVQQRVAELVKEHGSYRKAAAAIGVQYPHLFRIGNGQRVPRGDILKRLGLDPNTAQYQRLKS